MKLEICDSTLLFVLSQPTELAQKSDIYLKGNHFCSTFHSPMCLSDCSHCRGQEKRLLFKCVNLVRWPYPPLQLIQFLRKRLHSQSNPNSWPYHTQRTPTTFFHCFLSFYHTPKWSKHNKSHLFLSLWHLWNPFN